MSFLLLLFSFLVRSHEVEYRGLGGMDTTRTREFIRLPNSNGKDVCSALVWDSDVGFLYEI